MRNTGFEPRDMARASTGGESSQRLVKRPGSTLRMALVAVGVTVMATLVMAGGVISRLPHSGTGAAAHANPISTLFYHPMNQRSFPASSDGQVYFDAKVNDRHIHFRVDQTVSKSLLTVDDARAAGLTKNSLTYSARAMTPDGEVPAAPVLIPFLQMDTLTLFNVQAMVVEGSLPVSIVGTDFLDRFQRVETHPGQLVLHW